MALVVSLLALAVEIGIVDALEQGTAHDLVEVVVMVVLFGAVPAEAIGSIGAFVVHFATRGVPHLPLVARSCRWSCLSSASAG